MRGRPRSLMIGAVVAAAMSTAAIAFTGAQVQASAVERRLASDPPETFRRRRPPRSWRRMRAAKLRSSK